LLNTRLEDGQIHPVRCGLCDEIAKGVRQDDFPFGQHHRTLHEVLKLTYVPGIVIAVQDAERLAGKPRTFFFNCSLYFCRK